MIQIGNEMPRFVLTDQFGKEWDSEALRGHKTVIYVYPKDNTPGCTRQACAFAKAYGEFEKMGVTVIGVSKDSQASHVKFANNYSLPFILLSDPELQVIKEYGVWRERKLYGKIGFGVSRNTFIIDENGFIEKVMEKVKPDTNAAEILDYLKGEKK